VGAAGIGLGPTLQKPHTRFVCAALMSWVFAMPGVAAPDKRLDDVMAKLDQTAATFRSAEAKFSWTTFNSVVNESEKAQTGKIYFERNRDETRMSAYIDPPDDERVVFSGGKIQIYKARTATLDIYDAGTHREEFQAFLVLGFGSSGEDIRKSFDVSYGGEEKIDGIDTAKLQLVPKSDNIKGKFSQIILWIDLQNGVSIQQKLIAPNDDYRLAKYSDVKLNQKIPDKLFKLRTSDNTKVVTH
jgi:outer membrane lipoprotein-sorting protein